MSSGKRYNPVLFLTTFSVYLGLVLAGSPPQVLAQVLAESSAPHIQLELNKAKFSAQTSFERVSPEKIPHFSELFSGHSLSVIGRAGKTDLFEKAGAPAENDQIFVVTRLPRGSL